MSSTSSSTVLADSFSSLPSSRLVGSNSSAKRVASPFARVYKQASHLFLTRQLPEALQVVEPIVSPQIQESDDPGHEEPIISGPAPIATAPRNARVKVWSLYLTLINSVIELGPEEGRTQFGSTKWRAIVAKARDGSIWEDIVQAGYGGHEGNVDAEVVSNLATLLLSQSPSQTLNQQRLESYFSASSHPNLDISERFETLSHHSSDFQPRVSHANGTDTPRDLNSRIKILELYTLHVLPRNEEWDYAKEFINMSEILDDERRDVFLQTLQSLHEQKETDTNHEAEILRAQQEELERGRREAETKRQEDLKAAEATGHSPQRKNNHKRSNSEKDYGIDDPSPTTKRPPEANGVRGFRPTQHHLSHSSRRPPTSKQPPPAGVYKKGLELVHALQRLLFNTAQSMSKNPTILLRMVLFVLALVITLSRRGVRERVGRITVVGWDKIKRTFGMGVKVSYV